MQPTRCVPALHRRPGGLLLAAVVVFAALSAPQPAQARFYRYVDEDGRVCYTDNPAVIPPGQLPGLENADAAHSGARGASPVQPGRIVIHFEASGGAIRVQGRINRIHPVEFVVDTGATQSMITEDDARMLGTAPESGPRVRGLIADGSVVDLPTVRLASVEIGEARVENIEAVVGRMRLLGLDFLGNFEMNVDAGLGQLVLVPKSAAAGPRVLEREPESRQARTDREQAQREIENQISQLALGIKTRLDTIAQYRDDISQAELQRSEADAGLEEARRQTRFQGSGVSRDSLRQSTISRLEKKIADIDAFIQNRRDHIRLQEVQVTAMRRRIVYLRSVRGRMD